MATRKTPSHDNSSTPERNAASSRRRSGGTVCCVPGCKNNSARDRHVSFHGFPADKALRDEWIRRIGRPTHWQPSRYHKICGAHFNVCGKKTYEDRVPTIFPPRSSPFASSSQHAADSDSDGPIKTRHPSSSSSVPHRVSCAEADIKGQSIPPHQYRVADYSPHDITETAKLDAYHLNFPDNAASLGKMSFGSADIRSLVFGEPYNSAFDFLTESSKLLDENATTTTDKTFPMNFSWSESEPQCETSVEVELSTTDDGPAGLDQHPGQRNELDFLRNMLIDHMQTITEQAMEIDRLKKILLIRPSIEEVILLRIELAKQQQLRNDMEKRLTSQSVKITALTENIHMLEERLEKFRKMAGRSVGNGIVKCEDTKAKFADDV